MTRLRNPRHVVILGSGAMGCLFGGILKQGGLNVTLVDIWEDHVNAINRRGLRVVGCGRDRLIPVRATTDASSAGKADIVSVHCKAAETERAARSAVSVFGSDTVAISFQNGLGNEERLGSVVGRDRVLGGWTAQGANVVGPGIVRTYSEQPSHLGEMQGGISTRSRDIAAAFSRAGLPLQPSADIVSGIWKKLLVNVALSAPSAFSNLPIAEAAAIPEVRGVIDLAIEEAAAVAAASGVDVNVQDTQRLLDKLVGEGGTGGNKSSVCVDVLNERVTEIDFINGAIVRLGRKHGIPTPVNSTFVATVKGLESRYITKDVSP